MEQGVVTDQLIRQIAGGFPLRELPHQPQVFRPLPVEDVGGGAPGQQGQHHLGVEGALQVRLRLLRPAEPLLHIGDPRGGDRVPLALRPLPRLDRVHLDQAVPQQSGQGGVHLSVGQRAILAEPFVIGPFEVVPVAGLALQQGEQRVSQ